MTNYYHTYNVLSHGHSKSERAMRSCGYITPPPLAGFMDDVLRARATAVYNAPYYSYTMCGQARCGGRDSCFILSRPPRRSADRENFFVSIRHRSLRAFTTEVGISVHYTRVVMYH